VQEKTKARRLFLLSLLFFFLYLTFLLFKPYLGTIIFAVVLTSVCQPVYRRILQWGKGRKNLAAFLTATLLVVIVVVPLVSFSTALVQQGVESVERVSDWLQSGNLEKVLSKEWVQPLHKMADGLLSQLGLEHIKLQKVLVDGSAKLGKFILSWGTELLGNVPGLLVHFALMILMVFYLFRDGRVLLERLKHLSPLAKKQEEKIIQRIRALASSVVLANVGTAAAQGVAGGIGLWIAGISPLFWGTMMAFTSLIPVVGTALVWLPAAGYLLLAGSWGKALFLVVWSVLVVGSIDNFLRPFLMKGEGGISSIYLFFAILGGMNLFGVVGILYGPLILGVMAILVHLYEIEYSEVLAND
jgi:predicted PurR-regulated permease PerM